jgi:hypothetical protein
MIRSKSLGFAQVPLGDRIVPVSKPSQLNVPRRRIWKASP